MATVLIGLGGTGCNVLNIFAQRLKSNTSQYHEILDTPNIALWSIDADVVEYTSGFDNIWIKTELKVPFAEKVENMEFKTSPFFKEWFDPEWRTSGHINSEESPGAGQIKMNGRFAFYHNINQIKTDLDKLLAMSHVEITDRFYIITSLFGGTGSGMLFDLNYLLQNEGLPATEIRSFILDPSVLEVIDPRKSNSYSWISAFPSFLELDFWQSNNNKRNKSLQYSMHYNDAVIINSSSYLSKPLFLFGGKDQKGRSFKSGSSSLMSDYQKYIADVLFEITFTKKFKAHTGKNTIDNITEKLYNDHSTMYASVGLAYIKFPKNKLTNYLQYYFLKDVFSPIFNNSILHEEKREDYAVGFLKELKLLQNEFNQIIPQVKSTEEYINWSNALESFIDKVKKADNASKLSKRPAEVQDKILEKKLNEFVYNEVNKISQTIEGKNVNLSYSDLLNNFVIILFNENTTLPDIIEILKLISLNIEKEMRKGKELYSKNAEYLFSENYNDKYKKNYSRLKSSKNGFFKKDFNDNKNHFLRLYTKYRKSYEDKLYHDTLLNIYNSILTLTNREIEALIFIREHIIETINIKTPETNKTLRKTPFVFDKEKASNNAVYEINIGDNIRILKSPMIRYILDSMIQDKEIEKEGKKDKIFSSLNLFFNGKDDLNGFNEILNKILREFSSEDKKGVNDQYFIQSVRNSLSKLLEEFILKSISNKVEAIKFSDVFEWQFTEIYNYMKKLKNNLKQNPEEFYIAKGQFNAMFGSNADKLLDSLGNKNTTITNWVEEAIITFVGNFAKEVQPLWLPRAGEKPGFQNQVKVLKPKDFSLQLKSPGMDIFELEEGASQDRIAILKFSFQMPLSSLDFISKDIELIYDNHKKEKLSEGGGKVNPVHSDYRFYNVYSWNLFKSLSEMHTSLLTVEFALGFIPFSDADNVLERKKSGYFYYPSSDIPQKQIKLGTSYHKSFMKILGDKEIAADLINQLKNKLMKEIYSQMSRIEKSELLKGKVKNAIEFINKIKPAGGNNSDAYALWEMTNKNLTNIYKQINETNYLKLLNLD